MKTHLNIRTAYNYSILWASRNYYGDATVARKDGVGQNLFVNRRA